MSAVLQVGPLKHSLESALADAYDAVVLPSAGDRNMVLSNAADQIAIAVTSGRTGVSGDLMRSLPQLRAIVNFGVGYDTTDVAAAVQRGILVANTPDVLTDCVADTALALTLTVMRGINTADQFVRRGQWETEPFPLMRKVSGARVGILGLGRIGRSIAHRFTAFGCPVSYHSRTKVDDSPFRYVDTPARLAAEADLLVVATAGGSGSRHLVDRQVLESLGPNGYLINIARGSVVDEDALVDLLLTKGIAGAGLDVFEHEPHVPQKLLDLDNVVLLPHVASGTVETRNAMEGLVLDNVDHFLSSGTLITPVPETAAGI